MKKGFEPEAQGVMHEAFAQKADEEGMDHIARLFRAAAASEKVHALPRYKFMNRIGATKENLQFAANMEKIGYAHLYPEMIKDAEADGKMSIAQRFKAIEKVGKGHAEIFSRALKDPFSIRETRIITSARHAASSAEAHAANVPPAARERTNSKRLNRRRQRTKAGGTHGH